MKIINSLTIIFIVIHLSIVSVFAAPAAITDISAYPGSVEGAVDLMWAYPGPDTLPAGSHFAIQYANSIVSWSTASAQVRLQDADVAPCADFEKSITGLVSGNTYYFRVWTSSGTGELLSEVSSGATAWAQFDITAPSRITSLSALTGSASGEVDLTWTAPGDDSMVGGNADHYSIRYNTYTFPVEYCYTFEDASLSGWTLSGNANWDITTLNAYEGHRSIMAGNMNDGDASIIEKTIQGPCTLSFWWKVSSEDTDYLIFYIDNSPQDVISGEEDWAKVSFSVPSGPCTLKWSYVKGPSGSAGQDSAWVDNVFADADYWWTNGSVWKDYIPAGGTPGYQETDTVTGLLLSSKLYYFSIKAFDEADNWLGFSDLMFASPPDLTPPGAITGIASVTGSSDREIDLTWTAPGDDDYAGELIDSAFRIQYSSYSTIWSTMSAQVELSTTSVAQGSLQAYTIKGLQPGTTYFIRVWSADEVYNWSAVSEGTTIWAQVDIPPEDIADLEASQGVYEGDMLLTWTAPGDDEDQGNITGGSYYIKYSSTGTDDWSAMPYALVIATDTTQGDTCSQVITGLESGATYYFYIRTRDEYTDNWSSDSNKVNDWAAVDIVAPDDVSDLNAARGIYEGEVVLDWTVSGDNGTVKDINDGSFHIKYTDVVSHTFNDAPNELIIATDTAAGSTAIRNITGLTSGTTYYFWVKTADEVPVWSNESNKVSCWAQYDLVPPGAITSIYGVPGDYEGKVDLTWLAPGDNDIYAGTADYYEIRYSTDEYSTEINSGFEFGVMEGFTTGGNASWSVEESVIHTGRHAVQSGSISDNGASWIEADVTGPFTVSFWWKVSSQNTDYLIFYIDGIPQDLISGEVDWTKASFSVPSGPLTLKWLYKKDSAGSSGQDTAWLDDIRASGETWWDAASVWKNNVTVGGPAGFNESDTLTGLISGSTYYFGVRTCDEVPNWSPYSDPVSQWAQRDFIPPSAVSNLTALTGAGEGEVVLNWTAPGDSDETGTVWGYQVKYTANGMIDQGNFDTALTFGNEWTSLAEYGEPETRIVTGLTIGATMWFAIKGYDECDNYGTWNSSGVAQINTMCSAWVQRVRPAPITDLAGVTGASENTVTLSWTAVGDDGMTGDIIGGRYLVKCSSVSTAEWDDMPYSFEYSMDTSPGNNDGYTLGTGILDPGTTYYFYVKTRDEGADNYSNLSNKTTACTQVLIPPAAITDLNAEQGSRTGYIMLRWHTPGDDGWNGTIISGMSELKFSDTAEPWGSMPISMTWDLTENANTYTAQEITGLTSGTTYYFYVRSRDENTDGWSDLSNLTSTWASVDTGPPRTVPNLAVTRAGCIEGEACLTWTSSGDDYMTGSIYGGRYRIKYTSVASHTYSDAPYSIEWSTDTSPNHTESKHMTGLQPGVTYYYWIETRDEIVTNWSGESNKAEGWTQVDVTAPAAVNNLTGDRTGLTVGYLRLKWTATGDDNYSGNVTNGQYIIKYTNDSGKTFGDAENVIQYTTTYFQVSPQEFVLDNLLSGVTYFAWVQTADEAGNWSVESNPMVAWAQVDSTPPRTITDLEILQGSVEGEALLAWTAPGDDGTSGNIINGSYAVKYTQDIGHTWDTASYQITWGTTTVYSRRESAYISGLIPNASYYFFIKGADELGNLAGVSNKATGWMIIDQPPAPPEGLSILEVGSSYILFKWNANTEVDIDSYNIYYSSTTEDGDYSLAGSTQGTGYFHKDLENGSTYWYKVKSVDLGPNVLESDFSVFTSTWPRPNPTSTPTGFLGVVLSSESVYWSWENVAKEDYYCILSPTGGVFSPNIPANTTFYIETGIPPNTHIDRYVHAVNLGGFSPSATTYAHTYANPPRNLASPTQDITSIVLTWDHCEGGGNTNFTLQRSTDGILFTTVDGTSWIDNFIQTTYTDESLEQKSTYWYRIMGYNYYAIPTAYTDALAVQTLSIVPEQVRNLKAMPIGSSRITLTWGHSLSDYLSEYRIYYSTGVIDYSAPQDTVIISTNIWTSGALQTDTLYNFAVRAYNTYGNDDENTDEIQVPALESLSNVIKARLASVDNGMTVYGNQITLLADALLGSISDIASVTFKYKSALSGSWTTIADDTEYPFVASWDTSLLGGQYNVSVVATPSGGSADTVPGFITVTVNLFNADIIEDASSGVLQKVKKIYNDTDSIIMVGNASNNNFTQLTLPQGCLNVSSTTITINVNPVTIPSYEEEMGPTEEYREILFAHSQTELSNSKEATLIIPYIDRSPDDGKVDATGISEEGLEIYRYVTKANVNRWQAVPNTVLDTITNTCTVTLDEFSLFGIFGDIVTILDGAHPYPNPFKPNSGHTVIRFTEIPSSIRVRVVSIAGDLVFDRTVTDTGGEYQWDGSNNAGSALASGVYYYIITSDDGSTKRGKLAIIR